MSCPSADERLVWDCPTGSMLIATLNVHEDHNPEKARWFTSGREYVVESMHPIAEPPYVVVRCDDGETSKLRAPDLRAYFRRR